MQITEVKIRKFGHGNMKGWASIVLDNMFVVHDIKIMEGESGLYVVMPSKKTPTGEYRDVAHPITPETRTMIQNVILTEYKKIV